MATYEESPEQKFTSDFIPPDVFSQFINRGPVPSSIIRPFDDGDIKLKSEEGHDGGWFITCHAVVRSSHDGPKWFITEEGKGIVCILVRSQHSALIENDLRVSAIKVIGKTRSGKSVLCEAVA